MSASTVVRARTICGLFLCIFLTGLGAPVSFAQQPTQAQASAIRQSCRGDFQAHCAGVPTGGEEALACLKQNAASASPACQQALAAIGSGAASAPTGQARAVQPPAPSGAMQPSGAAGGGRPLSAREEIRLLRSSCEADYRTQCAGVPMGEGRAIGCLKAHAATLSPGCQNALMSAR